MRLPKSLLLAVLILFSYNVNAKGMNISGLDSPIQKRFFKSALSDLNEQSEKIRNELKIEIKDLGLLKGNICRGGDQIFGKSFPKRKIIYINKHLLKYIKKDKKINCFHKSMQRQLLATLYHEFAHVYAYENPLLLEREYLDLAFVKKIERKMQTGRPGKNRVIYTNKNTSPARTPDIYEYKNIQEHFAVNFEYFMLDSTYSCRRPELFNFLSKKMNLHPKQNCLSNRAVVINGDSTLKVELVASRIKSISYLLAGEGEGVVSGFGHSMASLDYCVDSSCLNVQKIIVSFSAYSGDFGFSSWDGFVGNYPSKVHFSKMEDTLQDYNYFQNREIEEFPILFSDKEKERFLNMLLKIYWEYNGKYYFVSNNCAVELFKLFQFAKNEFDFFHEKIITPSGILEKLLLYNLVDKPNVKIYKSFLKAISGCEKLAINVAKYIELDVTHRREILLSRNNIDPICFYGMERAAYLTDLYHFNKEYSAKLMTTEDQEMRRQLSKVLEASRYLTYGIVPKEGYGIPLFNESVRMKKNLDKFKDQKQKSLQYVEAKFGYQKELNTLRAEVKKNYRIIIKKSKL